MDAHYWAQKLRKLTLAKETIEEMVHGLEYGTFDPYKLERVLLATRDDLNLTIDLVRYLVNGTDELRQLWDDDVNGRCAGHGILMNASAQHRRLEHRPPQD